MMIWGYSNFVSLKPEKELLHRRGPEPVDRRLS